MNGVHMKFDPCNWHKVKTNVENKAPKGWLRLRLSAPCPVYVSAFGVEALAGFSASFDLEVASAVTFRIEAPEGVNAYVFAPECTSVVAEGVKFTNMDMEAQESHNVREVTQALRNFKLEQRGMMRELRAERAALQREREAAQAVVEQDDDDKPGDPAAADPVTADSASSDPAKK